MTARETLRTKYNQDLASLALLEDYLQESSEICSKIDPSNVTRKDLREIGALTDRFQRAQDFFVSHTLRTIDALAGDEGTTLDVLQRAEQRGIIDSAATFLDMRALRNKIAHEYTGYGPMDIVKDILQFTPVLLRAFANAKTFKII
jgi:uncharacterized protein YutE (UPF0331/DUF86 family)